MKLVGRIKDASISSKIGAAFGAVIVCFGLALAEDQVVVESLRTDNDSALGRADSRQCYVETINAAMLAAQSRQVQASLGFFKLSSSCERASVATAPSARHGAPGSGQGARDAQ